MATIKLKRGQESNRSNITPAAGEPLVSLDDKALYVGDGTLAGGFPVGTVKSSGNIKEDQVAVFASDSGRELKGINLASKLADYAKKQVIDTKIATVEGKITNVKATADGNTSKVTKAQQDADAAQQTADDANTTLQGVQTQLQNTTQLATDNQSTIQSVANQAKSTADTNTSDISTLDSRVTTLEDSGVSEQRLHDIENDIQANSQTIGDLPRLTTGSAVPDDAVGENGDLFVQL